MVHFSDAHSREGSWRQSPRGGVRWSKAGWVFILCVRWVIAVQGLTVGLQVLGIFKTVEGTAFGGR